MWLTVGLLVICFTIIVLFRMYIDLRRQDQQHVRLSQNDQRNHEKYMRVTRQEAIGEMTKILADLKAGKYTLDERPKQQAILPPSVEDALPHVDYQEEGGLPQMIPYKKAWLDPRTMTAAQLQKAEYDAFIQREQRRERERHYRR